MELAGLPEPRELTLWLDWKVEKWPRAADCGTFAIGWQMSDERKASGNRVDVEPEIRPLPGSAREKAFEPSHSRALACTIQE